MADVSGLTTLGKVVKKAIHRGRLPLSEYKLVFGLCMDGMRDLNLYTVKGERIQWLSMTDTNCINLPSDYLSFIKLGVPIGGRLWSFSYDGSIIAPTTMSNGVETLDATKGEGVSAVQGKFNPDGTSVPYNSSGYNSTGGHNNYNFTFDLENRRLVLDGIDRTQVLLVYKSNGISASGETLLSATYEEALLSFISWKLAVGQKNMSWSQSGKQEYYEECNKLKFLESPPIEAMYDAIYSTYRQGVKR